MKRLILAFTTTLLLAGCGDPASPSQSVQAADAKALETNLLEGLVALRRMTKPGFNLDATAKADLKIRIENLEKIASALKTHALKTFSTNVVKASELLDPLGIKEWNSGYSINHRNEFLALIAAAGSNACVAEFPIQRALSMVPSRRLRCSRRSERLDHTEKVAK